VVNLGNGSYIYFGLLKSIIKYANAGLEQCCYPIIRKEEVELGFKVLSVSLNIDGLPIHKSSPKGFWPILGILDQSRVKKPFVVALYYGEGKPTESNLFLRPLVDECKELEQHGITFNNQKFKFRVSCIIADAPARSFAKCIVSHNSLHGCEKCQQEGTYIGRTTWPYTNSFTLRDDTTFKNCLYDDHQRSSSILAELDLRLITQVPLDYMHLVCLGAIKRLIRIWVDNGPVQCRLKYSQAEIISQRLKKVVKNIPSEFSRKPRPIKIFKFWKATEFRLFLLYLGPVVLRGILPHNLYDHFLVLHSAIYILASDLQRNTDWVQYADKLMHNFVEHIQVLYSKECLVYNIHNLLHLSNDVRNFGELDHFSSFPFENYMNQIKRLVRAPSNPLQQVAKRLLEHDVNNYEINKLPKHSLRNRAQRSKRGVITSIFIDKLNCIVGTSSSDSCFVTTSGNVIIIKSIKSSPQKGEFELSCEMFKTVKDLYSFPLASRKIGITIIDVTKGRSCLISTEKLHKKCILLPYFKESEPSFFVSFSFCNMALSH